MDARRIALSAIARGTVGRPGRSVAPSSAFRIALGGLVARGVVGAAAPSARAVQPARDARPVTDAQLDGIIRDASVREGVDEDLIRAVMEAESGFRADAVSKAGAMGLMQLMPGTARGLGVKDPFDPAANVAGGAKYLRTMLDRFESVPLALAAYNAGPGAVEKYGGVPPYAETKSYVSRVMAAQERNELARERLNEGRRKDEQSIA